MKGVLRSKKRVANGETVSQKVIKMGPLCPVSTSESLVHRWGIPLLSWEFTLPITCVSMPTLRRGGLPSLTTYSTRTCWKQVRPDWFPPRHASSSNPPSLCVWEDVLLPSTQSCTILSKRQHCVKHIWLTHCCLLRPSNVYVECAYTYLKVEKGTPNSPNNRGEGFSPTPESKQSAFGRQDWTSGIRGQPGGRFPSRQGSMNGINPSAL